MVRSQDARQHLQTILTLKFGLPPEVAESLVDETFATYYTEDDARTTPTLADRRRLPQREDLSAAPRLGIGDVRTTPAKWKTPFHGKR